jgi:mono/diheme cytochrome c family protein
MRSPVKLLILSALALLATAFLVYTLITPGWRPVVVSIYDGPQLSVEKRIQDIGRVETDRKVRTEFLVYNKGGRHLRLHRVDASCGCTVADISRRIIAPGDFSRIRVVLDTSLKIGKIRKKLTLFSNDPQRPALALFVIGEAQAARMDGHAPITLGPRDRLTLFKGECASCHVQKGVGKTGQALFQADCAMCHGQSAEGHLPSGPSLLGGKADQEAWIAHTRRVIADGSPHSPQMPPFSQAQGGPLNPDEIDSLVAFLKFRNQQARTTSSGQASPENPKSKTSTQEEPLEAQDEAAFQDALRHPN